MGSLHSISVEVKNDKPLTENWAVRLVIPFNESSAGPRNVGLECQVANLLNPRKLDYSQNHTEYPLVN